MSNYHDISTYAELEKALVSVKKKLHKKENRISSDIKELKSECTPLGFVSGIFGNGSFPFNNVFLVWKALKVISRIVRRR